jgi:hypothetical protein
MKEGRKEKRLGQVAEEKRETMTASAMSRPQRHFSQSTLPREVVQAVASSTVTLSLGLTGATAGIAGDRT